MSHACLGGRSVEDTEQSEKLPNAVSNFCPYIEYTFSVIFTPRYIEYQDEYCLQYVFHITLNTNLVITQCLQICHCNGSSSIRYSFKLACSIILQFSRNGNLGMGGYMCNIYVEYIHVGHTLVNPCETHVIYLKHHTYNRYILHKSVMAE